MIKEKNIFIKNVLNKVNIVNILSNFLQLKKYGSGFFSKCPFHEEVTASFYVNEKSQKFYCFGCKKYGNVLDFIMKYNKCDIATAIKIISKNIPNFTISKRVNYIDVSVDLITNFFNNILKYCILKENIISNFIRNRKIDYKTLMNFKIGFVPKNLNFFLKKNKSIFLILNKLGFFFKKKNFLLNKFSNRIVFPIRNIRGNIIAFGGRCINDNVFPKYINSQESNFFSKKMEFYGIYEALKYKNTDSIIIVEGYFDVITLHQHGIKNVIAILGTALSKEHIIILKSLYKRIIFCFDGDNAGKIASIRSAYLCLSFILDFESISFIILPNKSDPDLFVKTYGKERFINLLNNSIFILDFIILSLKEKDNLKKNKLKILVKINKLTLNISSLLIKNFINSYISKFFQSYKIKKTYKNNSITALGIKACFFLLENRSLIFKINIKDLISNNKICFNSDINIFLDLVFLLKNNFNLKFQEINKRLIKRIIINNYDFIKLLKKMPKDVLEHEFFNIISKILSV